MTENITLCRRYYSEMDALIAKSVLDSEGIPCMIMRDDAGGMDPQFQMTLGVRLMVRQEDLKRALEMLEQDGEAKPKKPA